ncbi:MAG: hypothetical protein GF350_16700 [Chitinivibrionales bacterium]|nr:hypothetical protein [Chitinivibrionales bacterium]
MPLVNVNGNGWDWDNLVKIFGLQRSGTNFLSILLQENYNARILVTTGGPKHDHYQVPLHLGMELKSIVCTKNPYAWIASIHKYCKEHNLQDNPPPIKDFIRDRFTLRRTLMGSPIKKFYTYTTNRAANPIQYWNNYGYHWLKQADSITVPYLIVQYEQLLKEPEEYSNAVANLLKLERNDNDFYIPQKRLKGWGEAPNRNNATEDKTFSRKDYFINKQYLNLFDKEDIEFINNELDYEVMDALSYEKEIL